MFFSALFVVALVWAGAARAEGGSGLIGVSLTDHPSAAARVVRVRPGFPADVAGVQAGDLLIDIDGARPDGAAEVAATITKIDEKPAMFRMRRGGEDYFVAILPWRLPDPALDAELFPYPPQKLTAVGATGTAMRARVGERDYEVVSEASVFTWMRSLGVDETHLGRRVAFRARVANCDALAGAPQQLAQPNSSPLYGFTPAQSMLFDPKAAEVERLKCVAYFEQNNLDLSSPVVVVAGRLATDEKRIVSRGGPVLLIDALLFDNRHVTLGEQVVGLVDFVNSVIAWIE